jgi:hypothetical protein
MDRATLEWDAFWAVPERNPELARYLSDGHLEPAAPPPPADPRTLATDTLERFDALRAWNAYWASRSQGRAALIREATAIDETPIGDSIERGRLGAIRAKAKARKDLYSRFECPPPPWERVPADLLWNIANAPAAQVSMLLGLHGPSSGLSAACASFGFALHEACEAIQSGRIDAAVVGAVDAAPTPELVAGFYAGRLAPLGTGPSMPLCELRGTHMAGGACTWIIAAEDAVPDLPSLPVEILGIGLSSDAGHIITPSVDGPKRAIGDAFAMACVQPQAIRAWDMHATATPGDWSELALIADYVPADAVLSARKGLFGHGMSVAGGWELTALALGGDRIAPGVLRMPPSGIAASAVHPQFVETGRRFVLDSPVDVHASEDGRLVVGKLSMGIGGITSCVLLNLET